MNQTAFQKTPTHIAVTPLARLAPPHGYRFERDSVHLQAKFTVLDEAAYRRQWVLQLWACPLRPTSTEHLAGEIVSEVALPSMHEIADETEHLEISAFSRPPAGDAEHFMVLVLAAGRLGKVDEIHDMALYPRPQRFPQPRMRGTVGYRIEGDRVRLWAEHIENPRDNANGSGTLALELWAMAAPYNGGNFEGLPLAGVAIGSLSGQTESTISSFELPFSEPPAGKWHFVLMLREWTAAGYVTRDFSNFINPVSYPAAPVDKPSKTNPIAETGAVLANPRSAKASPPRSSTDGSVNSLAKLVSMALPSKSEEKTSIVPPAQLSTAIKPSVSINTAAEEELAAVEGLTPTLARAIVRKRPFASLDDLRRVKGVTLKLLTKIRSRLGL